MLKQAKDAAKEKIDKSPDPDNALTMLNNDSSFMLNLNKHLKDDDYALYLHFETDSNKKEAITLGNNFLKKYGAFYEVIDEDSEYAKKRLDALVKDKIFHVGFRKNTYSLTSWLFFVTKIYYETN